MINLVRFKHLPSQKSYSENSSLYQIVSVIKRSQKDMYMLHVGLCTLYVLSCYILTIQVCMYSVYRLLLNYQYPIPCDMMPSFVYSWKAYVENKT